MKIKHLFPELAKKDGEVIATFGQARLIRTVEGKWELVGGSSCDRLEAQEWISLFMHEAMVRES
jgi:hypothetical protein